jgi:hypothetical protein
MRGEIPLLGASENGAGDERCRHSRPARDPGAEASSVGPAAVSPPPHACDFAEV